jgi:Family of unknown function (DUF6165)
MTRISVPISAGELIDKVTILEIKHEHSAVPAQKANIARELAALEAALAPLLAATPALAEHKGELHEVNARLWAIEDDIRNCEAAKDFGAAFIALARAVYRTNDRRAAIKRQIDDATGSEIVEEKILPRYE